MGIVRSPLCALLPLIVMCAGRTAVGQTTINPDISIIPRFIIHADDAGKLSEGRRVFSRPEFEFEELEVAIQSYLNPFSKADVILTLPGPDLEAGKLGIEEVYATVFRGLPLDLNLRFGKYRAEFGKLNLVHPHAWPFATAPLVQERFLGDEGLNDLGISASVLLPTGEVYTKLTVDLLRGSSVAGAAGISDTSGRSPFYANSARLMAFFPLGDFSDLETGLSGYTGIHDPYYRDRFWYGNLDFKYKYRPSSYTSLTLQGEYLVSTRRARQNPDFIPFTDASGNPAARTISASGWYFYADYQFLKTYSAGVRIDRAASPYDGGDVARGAALFLGYYPVEETIGIRLQYAHTSAAQSVNSIALQVFFSLGPHKAHPF
ncbi:MAG: hypothetical protein AB1428_10080 [Bacteroidota bacterium]